MSQEKTYQTRASINYFNLQADEQVSVYGFVQQLPQFGLQTEECGACDFLEQIADTSISGGQAIIGVMRESRNNERFAVSQLNQNLAPSSLPATTPVPVINPIY
jgi:hypothetical protein